MPASKPAMKAATKSEEAGSRTCLVVAGMHRSGTSLFTRTAGLLGFALPTNPIPPGTDNESGFWESDLLVKVHDNLLRELGSAWFDWRELALSDPEVRGVMDTFRPEILGAIQDDFGNAPLFVLKDPRICRFIPALEQMLKDEGIGTVYLIPLREPVEVAESLLERDGLPLSQGILLWVRHVLDAEYYTRTKPRAFASYTDVLENWKPTLEKIASDIGISWPVSPDDAAAEIESFINPGQRHHNKGAAGLDPETANSVEQVLSWASEIKSLLLGEMNADSETRLDEIRRDFNLAAPILYAHHMNIVSSVSPSHDRLVRDVHFIRGTLGDIRGTTDELKQLTEVLDATRRNEAELAERYRVAEEKLNETVERYRGAEEKLNETVDGAARQEAKLTEEIGQLQQDLETLRLQHQNALADLEAADKAKRFAEDQCERLAQQIPHSTTEVPPPVALPADTPLTETRLDSAIETRKTPANDPDSSPDSTIETAQAFDVVIPVYNSVHWAAICLEELMRYRPRNVAEIIVVDDRSRPDEAGHLDLIVSRFPEVRLIRNTGDTGGFGHACNMGANAGKAPNIVFLNTDCLVTPGALDSLSDLLQRDDIAIACPFSNNSPLLTYPMFPGKNYIEMAEVFREVSAHAGREAGVEACTIVGNCLMVKRDFFESVGGFAPEWKEGYGEETELQMLATKFGLKGVVDLRAYVYHFGGGTFNYLENVDHLRLSNHQRFMKKWRRPYQELERRVSHNPPLELLDSNLTKYYTSESGANPGVQPDVLFYLPGLKQDIGGLSAVVAICNAMVRNGIKAACAIVGPRPDLAEIGYKEPVLFRFLLYSNDAEFLNDTVVLPKVVVSTIFTSAEVVADFAAKRNCRAVQFVQGYEPFFENGVRSREAIKSYQATETVLTTSSWLASMVQRHLSPTQSLIRLPLITNPDLFFPGSDPRDIDICFVLRSAPDKGQWMLLEIFDRLRKDGRKFAVLASPAYTEMLADIDEEIEVVESPVDHYALSRLLRRARVFVDASHHEGFGLLPLEAAMCGCEVVVSDSGGVRDINESHPITIVPLIADPQPFVDAAEAALERAPLTLTKERLRRSEREYVDLQNRVATWCTTIRELGENVTPVTNSGSVPVAHVPAQQPVTQQPGRLKRAVLTRLYRAYLRIKPFLPRRFTVAMRHLILGR